MLSWRLNVAHRASAMRAATAVGTLFCLLATAPAHAAMPEGAAGLIDQHVAAGEYGPAIELARKAAATDRDAVLTDIARSQAESGSVRASYNTLAEVKDGRARSQALEKVASVPLGAAGGGANFGPLINMITTTIDPDSWDDNSGPGTIQPFANGVYVDTQGIMRRITKQAAGGQLAALRRESLHDRVPENVRSSSALRKVSLSRLEREIQLRLAAGEALDEEMLVLAGLKRIQYVLVYPETGDVVVAGPASDWRSDFQSRVVSTEDGQPIVRLDDLLALLRRGDTNRQADFSCSIVPTNEGLAKAKTFIDAQTGTNLKVGQRGRWLEDVRQRVGLQQVVFTNIDPTTHVAQVMLEADHHMKLIGIGLEAGTLRVPSYLSMIRLEPGESPPALDVLRWWFTLNYDAVVASSEWDAFEIRGQGVQVQSENELLTAQGEQVHTGKAEDLNRQFARNFTKEFAALAAKYPVYGELRNVFDLALVASLLQAEHLADRAGWQMTTFADSRALPTATENVPKWVDTVMNSRVINRTEVIGAVSGGVEINPSKLIKRSAMQSDDRGRVGSERARSLPADVPLRGWWWD